MRPLLTLLFCVASCTTSPQVTTPLGRIKGHFMNTVSGREFLAFEGIPYGQPPVGKLRFSEPQPIQLWKEIVEATNIRKCIQYTHRTGPDEELIIGDEDCLYLNVYTPDIDKNHDVIIYIHGGAFMFNHGGSYGPKIILDRDVVYVTINYRLGPLGFLSTEDEVVPGNNGLKDQLLALKWIKQNIAHFGGNPESITLTGMSAGGASTQIHTLSPLSSGLFHRGISQSGTALNPWVLVEKSREKSQRLAELLNCPTTTTQEMIECLREKPAHDIVSSVKHFQPWLYNPFSPFGVVVDKWSANPILPEHPYLLLKRKKVQNLPWIFSNVECEGLYPAADFLREPVYLQEINSRWDEIIPHILDFNHTVSSVNKPQVLKKIREYYLKDQDVSKATFKTLVKIITDRLFIVDIEEAAKLHSAAIKSSVYYYTFSYRGAHSKSELRAGTNEDLGASHADDTVYVLSTPVDTQSTEKDREMSKLLLDMWITYANTSVPKIGDVNWTPITKDVKDLTFVSIESPYKITMQTVNTLGNKGLWESLPFNENKNAATIKDEL